jgi:hypothetical protein
MNRVYILFPEHYGIFRAVNYKAITANINGAPND